MLTFHPFHNSSASWYPPCLKLVFWDQGSSANSLLNIQSASSGGRNPGSSCSLDKMERQSTHTHIRICRLSKVRWIDTMFSLYIYSLSKLGHCRSLEGINQNPWFEDGHGSFLSPLYYWHSEKVLILSKTTISTDSKEFKTCSPTMSDIKGFC